MSHHLGSGFNKSVVKRDIQEDTCNGGILEKMSNVFEGTARDEILDHS